MIVAVADAGPLIHLAESDSLNVLAVLDTVLVPATVYEELRAGGVPPELATIDYELVEASGDSEWHDSDLDAGEIAAITVASEEDATLLTDDLDARCAATDAGIEFTARSVSSRWRVDATKSTDRVLSNECGRYNTKRACSLRIPSSNAGSNFSTTTNLVTALIR